MFFQIEKAGQVKRRKKKKKTKEKGKKMTTQKDGTKSSKEAPEMFLSKKKNKP